MPPFDFQRFHDDVYRLAEQKRLEDEKKAGDGDANKPEVALNVELGILYAIADLALVMRDHQ